MKLFFKKLNTLLLMSAVSVGIIFCCGFAVRLPQDITVNGVEVGGMTREAAVTAVRSSIENDLKGRTLKILGGQSAYSFSYPEISYKDNLRQLIKTVKKGNDYTAEVHYYLCGLDEIAAAICRNERIFKTEPHAVFSPSGQPFEYFVGNDGREVDLPRLKADISASVNGDFGAVNIKYFTVPRTKTIAEVKAETSLIGRYTTYFDGSNVNRASNIRLAAALINGCTVGGGQSFSFNDTVGARLPERGFMPAKIIENGEYVEGVGGGVCQVSTTLYNAALLSGMTVTEYHAHSLSVGYVDPSRDAMVSGSSCDMKFENPSKTPVYIRARTEGGSVTFELYGKSDGNEYSLESVVLETVPPPEEFSSDPSAAREGKCGLKSELYLLVGRGGYTKRVCLRRDGYLPQKRVIALKPTEDNLQEGQTREEPPAVPGQTPSAAAFPVFLCAPQAGKAQNLVKIKK